jgi:hypothetical protein
MAIIDIWWLINIIVNKTKFLGDGTNITMDNHHNVGKTKINYRWS